MSNELNAFEVTILDQDDLLRVSGGLVSTGETHSICHQDGVNDSD